MFFAISATMQLKTRYIQKRGSVFQFCLRVPADLKTRYGKQLIRQSLHTGDPKEAIKKAEPLAKHYLAEFERLRSNDKSTPAGIAVTAKELAQSWESMDNFIDHVVNPKRNDYAGNDEELYENAEPKDYLSPVEIEAGKLLREGLDTVRLSDAIKLYWKTHKSAGDAAFVKGVTRHWNKLVEHLGDVPVISLSRANARGYADHLLSLGWKTGTARRNIKQVNAILNTAIREAELTKGNPFSNLGIVGEGEDAEETPVPSVKVIENIVKSLRGSTSHVVLLTLLLVETGVRIGEFSGMKVGDVFLDADIPHVKVRPNEWRGVKTKSSIREFPLVGVSLEAMKKVLALPRKGDGLFPSYAKENGNTSASGAVNKRLKRWGINSHSFRHAMKDRLREAGCPQDIRDAIQGHVNGGIAEKYGTGHTLQTMAGWLNKAKIQVT